MYYNVFGEKVSRRRFKEMCNAAKNRRELIAAGLTSRRDLFKMGLLTSGGMLIAKSGLSARAYGQVATDQPASSGANTSPGTNRELRARQPDPESADAAFPGPPGGHAAGAQGHSAESHADAESQHRGGRGARGRLSGADHQFHTVSGRPRHLVSIQPAAVHRASDGRHHAACTDPMGIQTGSTGARSPGPTYQAFYGKPQLTRNINSLPPVTQVNNSGFGMPSVTTHLHNAHNPSESDGNPCDFYSAGHFCDQYYPNVAAGFNSDFAPNGDINESLSTLWYHDHRVDFTSQNTYKGLTGFYCLFNQFDTGDSSTGFHLPDFPAFDIPLSFADRVYDPTSGELVFDLFNLDGILGDKFLVNGKIQPFFNVQPRRYRFRMLDTGPSRFYEFFLTNLNNLGATNPYYLIGTDGNLLPHPIQVQSVRIGPAERVDVIVDFSKFAGQTLYLENRLNQLNGQGPASCRQPGGGLGNSSGAPECSLVLSYEPTRDPGGRHGRSVSAVPGEWHGCDRRQRRSRHQSLAL